MTDAEQRFEEIPETHYLGNLTEEMCQFSGQTLFDMVDDAKHTRMKYRRNSCLIEVDYATDYLACNDFIKDVSVNGVFIETPQNSFCLEALLDDFTTKPLMRVSIYQN